MISIVAKFRVKEGEENNFLELCDDLVSASRKEEGCIEYILHKDIETPRTYCMIEKWNNMAAIEFHNSTPHFTNTVPKIAEIAELEIELYEPL